MANDHSGHGHGAKLTKATVIVCGVASLVATLLSFVSIWLQTKNYRKPLLQRYVIRILFMVPIYSASSYASLMSQTAAFYIDPLRDIYEAFTIYTFFQLLINFLGGERSLIVMMHGRPPAPHPWPMRYCLPRVDISDPHTFLSIKRGILQYAWLKPVLGIATIVMKATNTYQEGYLGLTSGYLWSGIFYNLSVTLSLYSLAMFWVCMSQDLKPFRPVPKFLCIKLIIFATYWQGIFLSILQAGGAIPNDVPGYSPDNLAAAIQDAMICFEMPIFAIAHWYAFSWRDYADVTISAARMPVKFALRDAFGPRDLIEDTKETFGGSSYGYRSFDTGDNVLAHEDSESRTARLMEGMSRTPLLVDHIGASRATTMSYSKTGRPGDDDRSPYVEETHLDPEDERLFSSAKVLEFGDWNYPVITAHVPSAEQWFGSHPQLITTSTNRNLIQPTKRNKERRESEIQKDLDKGKHRTSSGGSRSRAPVLGGMIREESTSSGSAKSGRSQLVDLIVEDHDAEEVERVRARKEGGAAWNEDETKHFVRTYGDEDEGEQIREGFDPSEIPATSAPSAEFAVGDDEDEEEDADLDNSRNKPSARYGELDDRNIWNES
ncbi:hypothetical protein G7Y79_00052g087210 [Physcia stellaris]|nr:hypothetical protein G7Y79_00052g087210 [Physcia stellaris]